MGILGLNRNGKAIAKRDEAFGLKIAFSGCSRQL
jgi:lactate dehydrogenase-like 2-hydroxyacid dehydrogenase